MYGKDEWYYNWVRGGGALHILHSSVQCIIKKWIYPKLEYMKAKRSQLEEKLVIKIKMY